MPEGIPPVADEDMILDEIKKTIRHLDISASDFNMNLIFITKFNL